MPHRWLPLAVLLPAACSTLPRDPYVRSDYLAHSRGQVQVCLDTGRSSLDQAQALAEAVCRQFDRTAKFQFTRKEECNLLTPTLAVYGCVARPGEHPPPLVPERDPLRHEPLAVPGP